MEKWRCIGEPLLLLDRKMINKAAQGVHGLHNVALKELRGAQKEIKNISDALRALPRLDRRQRTYSSGNVHVSMFFVGVPASVIFQTWDAR